MSCRILRGSLFSGTLLAVLAVSATLLAAPRARSGGVSLPDRPAEPRSVSLGGTSLTALVAGRGTPSVVLLTAPGRSAADWERVLPEAARLTSVVALPGAPAGAAPIEADSLGALLRGVKAAPPYILVAHGSEAAAALRFAALHPGETAGLVLLDPEPGRPSAAANVVTVSEVRPAARQGKTAAKAAPLIPIVVLSPGAPGTTVAGEDRLRGQARLAAASPHGLHLVAGRSGTDIHRDAPGLVVRAVRWILDQNAALQLASFDAEAVRARGAGRILPVQVARAVLS